MNKKWKVVLCTVITILVLSTFPLAAQVFSSGQTSRTSEATAELFGTDVDDFLSYHYYGDVEFDKFFSYAGWRELNGDNLFSAGYARKFGGIYAALAYTGSIVSTNNVDSTKTNSATYDVNGVNTQTVTSETNMNTWARPRNQIDLLLGIAGMGFKVGFAEDLTVTDNPSGAINQVTDFPGSKYAEHRNIVDSYRNINGVLVPYLGWGMNLAAAGFTIRPYAEVALGIFQGELLDIRKNFNTLDGAAVGEQISVINGTASTTAAGRNRYENYIQPEIIVGADVVLKKNDTVELDAGLEYRIDFRAYNNAFDVFGISGSTPGKVRYLTGTHRITEGTYGAQEYQNVAANLTEETFAYHKIVPSFTYYQTLADNVDIGFNIAPEFGITTEKTLAWTETTTKNYTYPTYQGARRASTVTVATTGKGETDATTFVFKPVIAGGVTYTLIPNRFVLNAGLTAEISYTGKTTITKPAGYGRSVTTTTDADGNETESINSVPGGALTGANAQVDTVATNSIWSGVTATASAGFTLYFTPKFALDMAFSIAPTANSGTVDLNQVALLFSLKN